MCKDNDGQSHLEEHLNQKTSFQDLKMASNIIYHSKYRQLYMLTKQLQWFEGDVPVGLGICTLGLVWSPFGAVQKVWSSWKKCVSSLRFQRSCAIPSSHSLPLVCDLRRELLALSFQVWSLCLYAATLLCPDGNGLIPPLTSSLGHSAFSRQQKRN